MAEWITLHCNGMRRKIRKDCVVMVAENADGSAWIRFNGFDVDTNESYEEVERMLDSKAVEE